MSHLAIVLATFVPSFAVAAAQAHGDGIPSAVFFQAINFALYGGLLLFLLRGPIGTYFRNRESNYKQALSRAEAARASAEQRRREVQDRLAQLEATAEQALATARTDAEGLRVKLLADAEESARTLREEAHKTAEREISRAKAELREELLSQAVALSANLLKDKMAETDQKRLQTEFVDKIQVVR